MFKEHVGRSRDKSQSTKKKGKKDLKFDELEEKTAEKEISKITVKPKNERKYSPSAPNVADERRGLVMDANSKETTPATQLFQKLVQKETERVTVAEKKDGVGHGLFETANMLSSIVDITKDSTMRRRANTSDDAIPQHKPNKKTPSRSSLTSQTSQSGPFATLKENAEKKKKSFDEEELELTEPVA